MSHRIENRDIAIIGAGPAGLCAAISAAGKLHGRAAGVILLEGKEHPGSKLLISGSGQCNYTNSLPPEQFLKRLGIYANYLKAAFLNFDNRSFLRTLESGGCKSFIREDGKVFPMDLKAETVLNALLNLTHRAKAELRCQALVQSIEPIPGKGFKLGFADGNFLECRKLILASGGASYPGTGSDGKAMGMMKSLGHSPEPFRPHLSSVTIKAFHAYKPCAGISIPHAHAKFITSTGEYEAVGDLLITHQGFSGPLIMDNSHFLKANDKIAINWMPNADELLMELKSKVPNTFLHNALAVANIPHRLLVTILNSLHFNPDMEMRNYSNKDLRQCGRELMNCIYHVSRTGGIATAMASAGGIPLKEINSKTMESRLCPGLYFAGETMDYALPTGGFNIQMAASTGWMAGEQAAKDFL